MFCFQYCSAGRQSQSVSRYNHTSPATKISSKVLSKFFVLQTTYFSTLFKKESYTVSYLSPSFSVLTGLDEVDFRKVVLLWPFLENQKIIVTF